LTRADRGTISLAAQARQRTLEDKAMLNVAAVDEATVPGISIYPDDQSPLAFYVITSQPTFRLDDKGHPIFKFIKYRLPLNRPDGKRGGALVAFDVQFAVSDADMEKVRKAKQAEADARFDGSAPPVQIGHPLWMRGTAKLNNFRDDGVLVEAVENPAHPSLYGKNITPFFVELTPEGASVFQSALQGLGGWVQVSYELTAAVGCVVDAYAHYDASKSYDFTQKYISGKHWNGDDEQKNTITEAWQTSGAESITADFPPGTPDRLQAQVMDHLYKFLDTVVTGQTLADIEAADRTTGDQDINRVIHIERTENFDYTIHQGQAIEWSFNPQGTLPNITTIPGVKWADYYAEVDPANDPFFQAIHVGVRVDVDWANLPIDSVDVNINYGNHVGGNSFHFQGPNDVFHFDAYTSENAGSRKYKYSYIVNYRSENKTFEGGAEVDHETLTITVGELGILDLTVQAGAINFDQVTQAQVTIHYEDPANQVDPFEEVVQLDKDHRLVRYQKVIFAPVAAAVQYKVLFVMANNATLKTGFRPNLADQVFVNGPFTNTETINVRVLASFDTDIDTVFLNLAYSDPGNFYTLEKSVALNKTNPFLDWSFGVIDLDSGKVKYSGTIKHKDGPSEDIKETIAAGRLIEIGKYKGLIRLAVVPDLIDWTQVRLVEVTANYADPANGIDKTYSWIVRKDGALEKFDQPLKDLSKNSFTWRATLYMATNPPTKKVIPPTVSTDGNIIIDPLLAQ
jgi:hypothetical protein